jgi:hypothetical protein
VLVALLLQLKPVNEESSASIHTYSSSVLLVLYVHSVLMIHHHSIHLHGVFKKSRDLEMTPIRAMG